MEQLHKLKISIKIDKRLMDKRIVTSSENLAAALGDKERINLRTQLFNPIKKACHGDTEMQNEKLRLQTLETLGLFFKKLLFFDTMSNHTLFLTYTDKFKNFFFLFFHDFVMASLVYIEKYIFLGLRKWNRTELLTSNFAFSEKSRVENCIQ